MGRTVGELLEAVTSSELTEWSAFAELEPFGGVVDDLRGGLGPAATINANRGKDGKPVGPLDFYPWHNPALLPKGPAKPLSPEELAREIKLRVFHVKPEDL